jgi:magnesium transporter
MIRKYTHKNITWIDLEYPTTDEVRQIMHDYDISEIVGEELLKPTFRSKVDIFDHYAYFILQVPGVGTRNKAQEIDFILGKNFLITTRYEEIDPLLEFSKSLEVESILNRESMGEHAGFLFFYMMRHLYQSLQEKLDSIDIQMRDIESQIFHGNERHMVTALSKQARILLNFKISTDNHEEVLDSLEKVSGSIFGEEFEHYIKKITGECKKIRHTVLSKRDYIDELRDTNDSLLNAKQNEIMKIFTILAFVTFPISLVVEILGIPSAVNPVLGRAHDFWVIVGIVVTAILIMLAYFKKRDWL